MLRNHPPLLFLIIAVFCALETRSAQHEIWDGYNPFHQPANTTIYYGSGDANGDGEVTAADLQLVRQMAAGTVSANIMADVDASGAVDSADVNLVDGALRGEILPGWWNQLTTREQREHWVSRFMERDFTKNVNRNGALFYCGHTAGQCAINGTQYRRDLKATPFNGGQFFNIPVYVVGLGSRGHAINAILVGDDPLDIHDWFFIEPLSGTETALHNLGKSVDIGALRGFNQIYYYDYGSMLRLEVTRDENNNYTGTVKYRYHRFQVTRPMIQQEVPNNSIDLWNPLIVNNGSGKILYEQMRNDLSRTNDIHITEWPVEINLNGHSEGPPLTGMEFCSRLMDCRTGPDGRTHLLWRTIVKSKTTLMHGVLSPSGTELEEVREVSHLNMITGWNIERARIVFASGKKHVLYFCRDKEITGERNDINGLYWSYWNDTAWTERQRIASVREDIIYLNFKQVNRFFMFDAAVQSDGTLRVAYCDLDSSLNELTLSTDNEWSSPSQILPSSQVLGLSMISAVNGVVHMAYYKTDGTLMHAMHNGSYWTNQQVIDNHGTPRFPRFAQNSTGGVFLTYQKTIDGREMPVWNSYSGGKWHEKEILPLRDGADGWYPDIATLENDSVMIVWSSRGEDYATVEAAKRVFKPIPCDLTISDVELKQTEDFAAGNIITVGPDVVVSQPGDIQLKAGGAIEFKPGFSAIRGSYVEAFTTDLECD